MKKCLNCGNDCDDKFCPKCGQSTATGRTTWRSFSLTSLLEMLRFQGRNLHTCGELLLHPWTVIANYTAGRRVRYSSPLLFLLTLAILGTLLSSWAGLEDNDDRSSYLLRFHSFSSGMFTVCMIPPGDIVTADCLPEIRHKTIQHPRTAYRRHIPVSPVIPD